MRLFILSAFIVWAICAPSLSGATDQRTDASGCFATAPNSAYVAATGQGITTLDNVSRLQLNCPVPDRSDFLPQNMGTINVHGYNSRSDQPVRASARTVYWGNNNGGRVSNTQSYTGPGDYAFGFGTTQNGGFYTSGDQPDFKQIYVSIPPSSGGSGTGATLRGLYFAQ